jgi:hypothetical protein
MFHVGQRVVCVDAAPTPGPGDDDLDGLQKGRVYTVRRVDRHYAWVVEISRRGLTWDPATGEGWKDDAPFFASRFRPVKTTNIDVFLKLLEPVPA